MSFSTFPPKEISAGQKRENLSQGIHKINQHKINQQGQKFSSSPRGKRLGSPAQAGGEPSAGRHRGVTTLGIGRKSPGRQTQTSAGLLPSV